MDTDVGVVVRSCGGETSTPETWGSIPSTSDSHLPAGEKTSTDIIVGLPVTEDEFDAISAIVCGLTKTAHFIPVRQFASTEDTARVTVREAVRLHGVPKAIFSDRSRKWWSDPASAM